MGSTLPAASEPQLPGVDVTACDLTRKYGGGAFALIAPAGTITNPTIVSRNTLRHIGPSAGISINKNSMAELNHMYDEKDIQLDGSLVQGGAHDRYEVDNGQGKSVSEVNDEPVTSGDDRHADAVTYRYNWLHDTLNIRSSKRGLRFDRSQHICSGLEGNTWPFHGTMEKNCLLYTSPSPRDGLLSRMPSSA